MTYLSGTSEKPIIGITLGDFNGIGPEVILKTISDNRITKICTPVVYGSNKILLKYKKLLGMDDINFFVNKNIEAIAVKKINVINCWEDDLEIAPGEVTIEAGRCAFLSLNRATEDVIANKLDAIVTAPINKKNIQSNDFRYAGHTEFFADKTKVSNNLMMLISNELRVAVATGHVSLADVPKLLTQDLLKTKLDLLYKCLVEDFKIVKPKIAVLGINPHAGEDGLLGSEEKNILFQLIESYKAKGKLVFGPFPADGFFGSNTFTHYDGILAMYHDQGLAPFKALAFEQGVNYTAGMPIIRTSPDHGTAYGLAGKGIASETSFREALFMAVDVVKSRMSLKSLA